MLPVIFPKAVAWAEAQSRRIEREGAGLTPESQNIAARVGVRQPQQIRHLYVPEIPMPEDPLLAAAASQTGLIGPHIAGMTLGRNIFFREGTQVGPRLLSHERRHVFQYEAYGSIAAFLTERLGQVVTEGYRDAPLEIDAREHELQEQEQVVDRAVPVPRGLVRRLTR